MVHIFMQRMSVLRISLRVVTSDLKDEFLDQGFVFLVCPAWATTWW